MCLWGGGGSPLQDLVLNFTLFFGGFPYIGRVFNAILVHISNYCKICTIVLNLLRLFKLCFSRLFPIIFLVPCSLLPSQMIFLLYSWTSALIIYISPSRHQRNIVQQCTRFLAAEIKTLSKIRLCLSQTLNRCLQSPVTKIFENMKTPFIIDASVKSQKRKKTEEKTMSSELFGWWLKAC